MTLSQQVSITTMTVSLSRKKTQIIERDNNDMAIKVKTELVNKIIIVDKLLHSGSTTRDVTVMKQAGWLSSKFDQ